MLRLGGVMTDTPCSPGARAALGVATPRSLAFLVGLWFAQSLASGFLVLAFQAPALGCPFCDAVAPTLRQEVEHAVAGCLGIVRAVSGKGGAAGAEVVVTHVLRGNEHARRGDTLVVESLELLAVGQPCLLFAKGETQLRWKAEPISPRGEAYLQGVCERIDETARLRHCFGFLEDREMQLARDAYAEFAVASYDAVRRMAVDLDRDELIARINAAATPSDCRRLYLTMLGACGGDGDLPMLEAMLTDRSRRQEGLDALVACYLSLAGERGLRFIERTFLSNPEASSSETYQAVAAIRFHGTEGKQLSRSALASSLQHVLSRPEVADLVIADLARWNDWSHIDQLVALFESSDASERLLRVSIVNYLQACPLEDGRRALLYVHAIDPASVERASRFFGTPRGKNE